MSLCALQQNYDVAGPASHSLPAEPERRIDLATSNNVQLLQVRHEGFNAYKAPLHGREQRSAYTAEANSRVALYLDLLGGSETQPPTHADGSRGVAALCCNGISARQPHFEQVHAEVIKLLNDWKSVRAGCARETAITAVQADARARESVPCARQAAHTSRSVCARGESRGLATAGESRWRLRPSDVTTTEPAVPCSPHCGRASAAQTRDVA
jgi:hypothetical protein